MDETTHPTIYGAMAQVFREVSAVAKSLRNEQAGYSARSIDDVMDALHGPMAEAGVFVTPMAESVKYDVVEVGRNRTPMRQASLKVRFRFHGPAGDFVDAVTYGEALDSGDKATNKAASAAFKTALLQTFVIPVVGVDADATSHERSARPRPAPPEMITQAKNAAETAGIGQWVKDQGFPWPWPEAACDAIFAKVEALAAETAHVAEENPAESLAEPARQGDDEPPSPAANAPSEGTGTKKSRSPSPSGD